MLDITPITNSVLVRLLDIDYEKDSRNSTEQLIFPSKRQIKGDVKRISEQELRFLFVEEFKKQCTNLFYSIETPTEDKYKFGKSPSAIMVDNINGQSALLDMCVFSRNDAKPKEYQREINIEFKHKNPSLEKISKDILKLINEPQDGAFIHLLENTDSGTFCNDNKTGVFDKLHKSFVDFKTHWKSDNKAIQIVILSLTQKTLIYRTITKADLVNLDHIFFSTCGCGNITAISAHGWGMKNFEN